MHLLGVPPIFDAASGLHFLQHHPTVPVDLRAEAGRFGLCADEFTAAGGWPEQVYVREARRLVGRQVFTEHDARRSTRKQDAIAVGSYPLDSHATQWYRVGQRAPAPEGFFMCSVRPYEIPYGCLLPESPSNLLVPVCLSASHAGYGTLRMEPVMMNLGMVCGVAAALAKQTGASVTNIEMDELHRRLRAGGQVTRIPWRSPATSPPTRFSSHTARPGADCALRSSASGDRYGF